MSDPTIVYSTRCLPFTLEEIRSWAGGAQVRTEVDDGVTVYLLRWPDCTLRVHPGEPPEGLDMHLAGLRGFIWQCAQQKMTQGVYALIQRTYQIHHLFGTVAEPALTESAAQFLRTLAAAGRGLIFRELCLHNPDDLLIGPEEIDENQRPWYWPDALTRKERSMTFLAGNGLQVPPALPPVPGEQEVVLRSPQEVGRRALALFAVASRAVPGGISRGAAKALVRGHESALAPSEAEYLSSFFPGKADKIAFSWRFEALWVLLWALGYAGDVGAMSRPVTVETVNTLLGRIGPATLPGSTSLRPTAEILDQLDLVYRCHWATTDERVNGTPCPAWLDPGVVSERHHALNWLTCHQDADWDDVTTDT